MVNFIINNKKVLIGIGLGAIAGFLYWHFIGCSTGGCPLTSRWYNSTIYGAVMGFVLAMPSRKKTSIQAETKQNEETQ